ncbi:MAG: hypothetical protein K5768_01335 [Firmicutes bacterium]|nr:hypothetical protein [Bacillota bacterium]
MISKEEILEYTKKNNEIKDLYEDYKKTECLLRNGNEPELEKHMKSIFAKYFVEAQIYNIVHPQLPSTVQQNALNCMDFLFTKIEEKIAEIATV